MRADEGQRPGAQARERLRRATRLTATAEIKTLFRRGKRSRTRHLDVLAAASPVAHSRWGVVVPKHKHRIVERNLLKRRLREIGRRAALPLLRERGRALDVLVRARAEAYGASFAELRTELLTAVEALCSRV